MRITRNHFVLALAVLTLKSNVSFAEEKIKIQGGVAPLENIFKKIQAPFEKDTGIKLELKESSSESAILDLEKGETDLAVTGVPWKGIEELLAKDKKTLKDDKAFRPKQIGRDIRVVLVNKKTGVKKLDKEQLAKIATGKIKNWKEVGGADLPIKMVFTKKSPGLYLFWKKSIMNDEEWSKENTSEVEDLAAAQKLLAEIPGGYTIAPSSTKVDTNLMTPEIPVFGVPLTAYTLGVANEKILKLYDYLTGPGKKYIE